MTVYWSNLQPRLDGIKARLDTIEQYLVAVSEKLGVPFTPPASELPADVVALAQAGDRLGALKRYRELTGADLQEAQARIAEI
jgi:ribosomal protein L7/L12